MAPRQDQPPRPPEAGPNWVYNPELGRWTPPDAAQAPEPTTTTPGGQPLHDDTDVPLTFPAAPPGNLTDDQSDAWYQQQQQAVGDYLSKLSGQIDDAVTALDTAQAAMDTSAILAAGRKLQSLRGIYDSAIRQQNNYATQQGKIRDRAARVEAAKDARTMTPEQQAEHEARMAGYQSAAEAQAAQIAENNANRDLTSKRIEWEQAKFNAENDPARLKADDDYKAALSRQADAATNLNKANTDAQKIKNDIESQWGAKQAGATYDATVAGKNAQEAQTRAYNLEVDVNAEKLRQQKEGTGVTLHRQLAEWIAAAPDDATARQREAAADAEWTRYESGGSQLDWQTKLNDTAVQMTDNLAARGMLTSGRGLDPTGAISKALGTVGLDWQEPTPQLTSIPGWAKAAGINLQAPQYSVGGASAQPVAAGATGVPTQPVAPAVIDHTGQSWEQIKASMQAPQGVPAQPQPLAVQPTAPVPAAVHAARGAVVYAVPGWARGGRY